MKNLNGQQSYMYQRKLIFQLLTIYDTTKEANAQEESSPVSKEVMEPNYEVLFFLREIPSLYTGT